MKIHRNDTIEVIAGKDKGKKGTIRHAYPLKNHVIAEGINMIKRHTKAQGRTRQAGIISKEAPIHISNIMLICSKCNKPTRVGFKFLEKGEKVRVCKKCQEVID